MFTNAKSEMNSGSRIRTKREICAGHATVAQLICLSNLENLNAMLIANGEAQSERLKKLNRIAINQMKILTDDSGVKRLSGNKG